jgi:hypothetical protein
MNILNRESGIAESSFRISDDIVKAKRRSVVQFSFGMKGFTVEHDLELLTMH